MNGLQAAAIGQAVCHTCGRLGSPASDRSCQRCGTVLHFRKPDSIQRSWALLMAAYALYLPANLLPIMETRSLFGAQQDTIMSGVVYLWSSGSWVLASVVFIASVAVPLLKMLSLTVLLVSVHRHSRKQPLQRTKLYRLLELIGRWSMLDLFVISLTMSLINRDQILAFTMGPAAFYFGAAVILTILAVEWLDSRLLWDAHESGNARFAD